MESIGNGVANVSPNPPVQGEMVTIWANPDPGYTFVGWQVISGDVTLSSTTKSPATFEMPDKAVKIRAIFIEVFIPPILVEDNEKTYTGFGITANVHYNYDNNGNQITSLEAGTLAVTYVNVNGSEYTDPVDAGIYGIYITTSGGYGYPAFKEPVYIGTLIIKKAPGDPVGSPTLYYLSPAYNSIRINPVPPPTGQDVEYAISDTYSAPADGWQPGLVFHGLTAQTNYNIFARSAENNNYTAGPASAGLSVTTLSAPDITIVGGSFSLPEGGAYKQLVIAEGTGVTWASSDPGVATVDPATGLVTSVIQGSARITATTLDLSSTYSVIVTVQRKCWMTDIDAIGVQAESANGEINIIDAAAGKFTLKAKGQVNTNLQVFSFLYLPVTGDFTMMVKIDSIKFGTGTGTTPVAGIIAIPQSGGITQNPTTGKLSGYPYGTELQYASATISMSLGNSTRRWWRRVRSSINTDYAQVQIGTGTAPDTALNNGRWIKLSRTGNFFTASYSEDGGANWEKMPNQTNYPGASENAEVIMGPVYVGLWVAAGQGATNNGGYTIAGFSEWSFMIDDGNATHAQLNATSARINLSNL